MRRGSTPTFCFRLPEKASFFSEIDIIFVQNGKEILQVDKSRLTEEDQEVSFTMTVEESLSFAPSLTAELQLRLVDTEGNVWISEIRTFTVRKKYPEDRV